MGWYESKVQLRPRFLAGRRRRSGGVHLLHDKKTGETLIVAQNGCFGNLANVDRDAYDLWAQGTRGAY